MAINKQPDFSEEGPNAPLLDPLLDDFDTDRLDDLKPAAALDAALSQLSRLAARGGAGGADQRSESEEGGGRALTAACDLVERVLEFAGDKRGLRQGLIPHVEHLSAAALALSLSGDAKFAELGVALVIAVIGACSKQGGGDGSVEAVSAVEGTTAAVFTQAQAGFDAGGFNAAQAGLQTVRSMAASAAWGAKTPTERFEACTKAMGGWEQTSLARYIPLRRPCDHCRAIKTLRELPRCSRCRQVRYCQRECQRAAWGGHKQGCAALAALMDGGKPVHTVTASASSGEGTTDPAGLRYCCMTCMWGPASALDQRRHRELTGHQ